MYYAKCEVGGKLELENFMFSSFKSKKYQLKRSTCNHVPDKIIKMTKGVRKGFK